MALVLRGWQTGWSMSSGRHHHKVGSLWPKSSYSEKRKTWLAQKPGDTAHFPRPLDSTKSGPTVNSAGASRTTPTTATGQAANQSFSAAPQPSAGWRHNCPCRNAKGGCGGGKEVPAAGESQGTSCVHSQGQAPCFQERLHLSSLSPRWCFRQHHGGGTPFQGPDFPLSVQRREILFQKLPQKKLKDSM